MKLKARLLILCWGVISGVASGQPSSPKILKKLILKIDTLSFEYPDNTITYQGESCLYFKYENENPVCELNIYPSDSASIKHIRILRSAGYEQLDSMVFLDGKYFKTRIRFLNLSKSQFLGITFKIDMGDSLTRTEEVRLLPYTQTKVFFYPSSDELFIGEEKVFELISNHPDNIRITNEWTSGEDINYRTELKNGQLMVHLLAGNTGTRNVRIRLQTLNPFVDSAKNLVYDLPVIVQTFRVKASRLSFLNIDKKEITYDDDTRKNGIEVILDNNRNLVLGKTYRIEDQEQPGGPLIAELFTKSYLANDRVLCILRPYNLHRQTEGYLYIKDGDDARFITNINITPRTTVNSIEIMRNGQDWTSNLTVYPGETVNVKLEGDGFQKARFHWDDAQDITTDTLTRSENVCYFKLHIPLAITKRQITLYNNSNNTGKSLNVHEYQTPRNFDFISLNYGNGNRILSSLSPTVIQRSTIKDVDISFNRLKIDSRERLYGKQYLDLDISLVGRKGELIEMKSVKNLVICPGDNSPRAGYYSDKQCTNGDLSLNSLLGNKTFNLDDFSKIQLSFKDVDGKYSDPGYEKKVEITLQRPVIFDIDVSFPAGLLIQNLGKTQAEKDAMAAYETSLAQYNQAHDAYVEAIKNWTSGEPPAFTQTPPEKPKKAAFTDNLGGISLALITQFSFPDAEKVGKLKPYRIGAGFLAINAFNFSSSANRDLAAVVLASLYPVKPGKVFNLPIHLGFGYKFQDKIPFLMLSPGIGIRF